MKPKANVYWLVSCAGEIELDPARKFWKELIRVGEWTNAAAGFTLEVDKARLETWKKNFDEMLEAGIRVPVPWGHSYDPRDNAGFVEELEIRGDSLWGLLHVANAEDAEKLGSTVWAVSVSINPSFVDGSGRHWGEVIEHVALTNYPVVIEQSDFEEEEQEGDESAGAVELELAGSEIAPDFAAIARVFGVEPGKTGRRVIGALKRKFDGLTSELEGCRAELIELRALNLDQSEVRGGEARTAREPGAAPRNAELETRLKDLERERAERQVDEAMRLGKFTRPAAEALRRLLTAAVEARYALDSSAAYAACDVASLVRHVIDATPPKAAVDTDEHTLVHPMPDPSGPAMSEARAAQLARENRALAGM